MTGEKIPPRCPETADAMADGDLTHEHVDAVLDVMAKVPAATPPEVRDLAEEQLAEIARHTRRARSPARARGSCST